MLAARIGARIGDNDLTGSITRVGVVALLAMVAACGGLIDREGASSSTSSTSSSSSSSGSSSGASSSSSSSSGGTGGPYDIVCDWFVTPPPKPGDTTTLAVRSDGNEQRGLYLNGQALAAQTLPASEPDAATFYLRAPASTTTVTYEATLLRNEAPLEQFVGGHGFSGLFYFAGQNPTRSQAICRARPASPPSVSSPSAPRTKFRIACDLFHRPDWYAQTTAATPALVLDGPFAQKFGYGAMSLVATMVDGFDGRLLRITISRGNDEVFAQLLQLDATMAVVNHLRGPYGLTGYIVVEHPSGEQLAYGCRAE